MKQDQIEGEGLLQVVTKLLPDPRGAGHAKAFQISSVGPSVGRSVGLSVGRLVGPVLLSCPSVRRSVAPRMIH